MHFAAVRESRLGAKDIFATVEGLVDRAGKFVRRMGDDFPRAIDLVSSDRLNVRALVTHRESVNAAPEIFKALAQNRPGYLKALHYPNGDGRPAKVTARNCSSSV